MGTEIVTVMDGFVAEVSGVDLRDPLDGDTMAIVRDAFARHPVLVFPGQELTGDQHLAFAARFGPLERQAPPEPGARLRVREELADIANLDADGKVWTQDSRQRARHLRVNRLWHSDSSYRSPGGYASFTYARVIPPVGGHLEFADLHAAWIALPAAVQRRLQDLVAEHSLLYALGIASADLTLEERAAFAPVVHPLVRTLPESRRTTLYIGAFIGRVHGLRDEETAALLDELIAHATQPQFVYRHRWRVGDLVMWDNRCTMHRGTYYDDLRWPRDVQRATTAEAPARRDGAAPPAGETAHAEPELLERIR